ncbi:MAG: flagellar hook-associated protein FlgK, partial [Alphaproteobacteria bacterium]|nr:flagellar hook-associated protein FlgK [Alphaproteobacteria bacterium]
MGLTALDSALTGLRIAQQQIGVVSSNISNATTAGYTRKIMPQSTQVIEGMSIGVRADTIVRKVDINLERDLWTQISSTGFHSVQASYLQRVEQFHGAPGDEISIASEISRLKDSFSALSVTPEDTFLLSSVMNQAGDAVNKINQFSNLITTLRNDAQDQLQSSVAQVNGLLEQITLMNREIADNLNFGQTTAAYEDKRDAAISELSDLIQIKFYQRGDGVMVVQTKGGVELAATDARVLTFNPTPLSASNFYPDSAAGLYVTNPDSPSAPVEITASSPGGKIGGLLKLRDVTFPKQMAQLDETAHKLALRFQAQGLRLFTDQSGTVPLDTPPDPTTDPPTPVTYVGFSGAIQLNEAIVQDHSLLRKGTYGGTVEDGSGEVIRRVLDFAFGATDYNLAAASSTATSVDLLNRGGADLQTWLGLFSSNELSGGRDLSSFVSPAALIASANGILDPGTDTFRLTFEESRTGTGPVNLDISLSAIADGAGDFVQDLMDHINTVLIPALGAGDQADLIAMDVQFSEGSNGQFVMQTRGSLTVDGTNPANPMLQEGLNFLGLVDNSTDPIEPEDPYFDIQVGSNNPTRITLEPGDTDADLLAKLAAVDGLAIDTVNFALDGFLRLRPGNDFDDPDFGGDLKITGGPFSTAGAGLSAPPAASGRTSIADGVSIVSALFGTYTAGVPVVNSS